MKLFKSHRVNLDREPYRDPSSGVRFRKQFHDPDDLYVYDPRPQFEPTRDPLPWWSATAMGRTAHWHEGSVWAPRREEFDTPVNPILVNLRLMRGTDLALSETLARTAQWMLDQEDFSASESAEMEHARVVLTAIRDRLPRMLEGWVRA